LDQSGYWSQKAAVEGVVTVKYVGAVMGRVGEVGGEVGRAVDWERKKVLLKWVLG
jgi:Ser-tRNA(Ala) deacylase AlaX